MNSPFSSKFVTLIRTFKPAELDLFEAWLSTPFHTSNKHLRKLLRQIRRHYPGFSDSDFSKEQLFREVVPKGKFSNRWINNLLSEGFLAAREFLSFQYFQQDSHWKQEAWLTQLRQREIDKWYFKEAIKEKDQLQQTDHLSWEEELLAYRLQRDLYHHPSPVYRSAAGNTAIYDMSNQLDLVYCLEKGAILAEKISRSNILKSPEQRYDRELKIWLALSEKIEHPSITLYRLRFMASAPVNLDEYGQLSKAFLRCFSRLEEKEQRIQLFLLLNDTTRLVRQGQLAISSLLPLYKIGLHHETLLPEGRLSYATFTNIIVAANTSEQFAFTKQFIGRYADRLEEEIREDCLRWARAHMAFYKKDPEACTRILGERDIEHPQLKLVSRLLHTQAYFELFLEDQSYDNYLYNYLSTFEKWLNRNRYYSRAYLQTATRFVQKCRQMALLWQEPPLDRHRLQSLFEDVKDIQAPEWLKQKQRQLLELAETE